MTSAEEYVYCVDSANIIHSNLDQNYSSQNNTNDIIVKIQMTSDKLIFKSIELVSLELPAAQRLIEPDWNRIYLFAPLVFENDETSRTLSISGNNFVLPTTLNSIISIDLTDPLNPIFTTESPHLLESALPVWHQSWFLIGTAEEHEITMNSVNILNSNQFSVQAFSALTVWNANASATNFGFLYAPPISSPVILCKILNALMQILAVSIKYDVVHGEFTMSTKDLSLILQVERNSLLFNLGFSSGNYKFNPLQLLSGCFGCNNGNSNNNNSISSSTKTGQIIVSKNGHTFSGFFHYTISPSSPTTIQELISSLDKEFNRFYFKQTGILTFSDMFGVTTTVTILPGLYTPLSLSQSINSQLTDIEVTFANNTFTFSSLSNSVFNMIFEEPTSNIQSALGFHSTIYTSLKSYSSNIEFEFEKIQSTSKYPALIFHFDETTSGSNQLFFHYSSPPPLTMLATIVDPNTISLTSTTFAHGFQQGDIANIQIAGISYHLFVDEIVDGTTFLVNTASFSFSFAPNEPVNVSHTSFSSSPDISIMFAPRKRNGFIANVLGFSPYDLLQPGISVTAPYTVDLNGRFYVMVEIRDPIGSARVEQLSPSSHNKTSFIGKAILVNTTVRTIDRFYPMKYTFFPPRRLTELHIRFLNPDHSLYELHGKRWSLTLLCRT